MDKIAFLPIAILVLGVLIFVHELGHFLIAKLCKVGVIEFSVGFGKKIWRRRYGETHYAIGAIPLGGYVKMVGDDPYEVADKSSGTKVDAVNPEKMLAGDVPDDIDKALLADRSRWFLEKGILSKAAIVLAGPGFNVLFAIFLAIFSFTFYGKVVQVDAPVIGEVLPDNPAANAGLLSGDKVKSIDGTEIQTWEQLAETVRGSNGKEMTFKIERSIPEGNAAVTQEFKVTGTLENSELSLLDDNPNAQNAPPPYRIGIMAGVKREPVQFSEAVQYGTYHVWYICRITFKMLGALVKGTVAPSKVVGGPIAVFAGAAQSAKRGLESTIDFMVLLSVSLAIFNLLPIPVLDGGHLMFFLIEAIKGSPVNIRWQVIANQVGMVLLMALMIFALRNDVLRFF